MIWKMRRKSWRAPIAVACQLLVLHEAWGQQPAGQRNLRIVVVEGEGSRNMVQQIAPRPLIVGVQDGNGRPVAGASVVFSAPELGPSGLFENDTRTIRVTTTQDGLASAGVFHPNSINGAYQIRVTAESQGETAIVLISQTNVEERGGRGKWIAIAAIAGAAVGAAFAFRNKDQASPNSGPTITFGGSAVGAPR